MFGKTTYNEGQYGLKPWMANVIMSLLEVGAVVAWFFLSFMALLDSFLSFSADKVESTDVGITLALCAIYLVWNLLVWFVGPLRTKFNMSLTKYNVGFIVLTIVEMFL